MHPTQAALDESADSASAVAAKHSVQHAATVALLDGRAGLAQFRGEKLRNERVNALRARIELAADPALPDTAAHVTITQPNGTTLERLVRCALGHPLRPLGDRELSDKFRGLAGETLATGQAERLLGLAWNVRALPDMGGLIRTMIPEDVYEPAELPGSPLIPR
jgi:2-methylcitrate dehydratase PrpD